MRGDTRKHDAITRRRTPTRPALVDYRPRPATTTKPEDQPRPVEPGEARQKSSTRPAHLAPGGENTTAWRAGRGHLDDPQRSGEEGAECSAEAEGDCNNIEQ